MNVRGMVMGLALLLGACSAPPPAPQSSGVRAPVPLAQAPRRGFAALVQAVGPAVVNVSSTQLMQGAALMDALPHFLQQSPLAAWLNQFLGGDTASSGLEAQSLGAGFILTGDGYILTNRHVIKGGNRIRVRLTDGREYPAQVIGADQLTDVALLKINASGLPVAPIGNPGSLQAGDWVVAIGAPFGFENSVTAGIVSALGRSLPQEDYVPFIQSDVAVNPGNSGGPLFNMSGQVVGINSQIYSETGGWMGVSFAIPIDVALNVAHQLKDHGRVVRGRIGVVIQEVTPQLAQALGLPAPEGALVARVRRHGAADQAGIRVGDVITRLNGQAIQAADALPRAVAAVPPGTHVTVMIWRQHAQRQVELVIGQ